MRIPKVAKYAFVLLGFFEVAEKYEAPHNLRRWVLEMHKAQIELLKMDWGHPGFSYEGAIFLRKPQKSDIFNEGIKHLISNTYG